MKSQSSGQPKIDAKTFFPTPHPLSPAIFATATVVAFVLLYSSRLNFHRYTQHEATPTQKSARKWCSNLSWLTAQKITKSKGIHLCKLNEPPNTCISCHVYFCKQSQEISLSRVVNIRYLLIDILWGAHWLLWNPSLFFRDIDNVDTYR